jgi:hypothetical protein
LLGLKLKYCPEKVSRVLSNNIARCIVVVVYNDHRSIRTAPPTSTLVPRISWTRTKIWRT